MFADADLVDASAELHTPGRHLPSMTKPRDYTRPERDVFDYAAVISGDKSMTDTIDQDVELLSGVQAGMQSSGFDRVFLSDDEIRVQHFHNQLQTLIPAYAE